MPYDFRKLAEAVTVDSVDSTATILVEQNGEVVRVPKKDIAADQDSIFMPRASEKIKDYLYEFWYDNLDYKNAEEYFAEHNTDMGGACSSVRNGNFFGRNFDWFYNNQAEFIIHVPKIGSKHASIGIAGGIPELTEEFVNSGEYSPLYKLLPFRMLDGINDSGVVVNTNVVPTDNGENEVQALVSTEKTLSARMLIRFILDNFSTATEAVTYVRDHVDLYFPGSLHEMDYELHFMVCDASTSYCLEFVNNHTVVINMTENTNGLFAGKPYMTNFLLDGVTLNEDGSVFTPETQTETDNPIDTNGITEHGAGLERYNLINANYSGAGTKEGMRQLMTNLKYTKAYPTAPVVSDPYWYTELVGKEITVDTPASELDEFLPIFGSLYTDRDRDTGLTWQTVHSSVYDIEAKKLYVIVQEDGEELEFEVSAQQEESGTGAGLPDAEVDGTAMIWADGEWIKQPGYGYSTKAFDSIEWDGELTNPISYYDGSFEKVSSNFYPLEDVIGSTATFVFDANEFEYILEKNSQNTNNTLSYIDDGISWYAGLNGNDSDNVYIIAVSPLEAPLTWNETEFSESGIYFYKEEDENEFYRGCLALNAKKQITPLSSDFIADNLFVDLTEYSELIEEGSNIYSPDSQEIRYNIIKALESGRSVIIIINGVNYPVLQWHLTAYQNAELIILMQDQNSEIGYKFTKIAMKTPIAM